MPTAAAIASFACAVVAIVAVVLAMRAATEARRSNLKAEAAAADAADIAVRAINAQEVLTLTQRRMARTIDALLDAADGSVPRWEISHDSGPMFDLRNVSSASETEIRILTATGSRILDAPDGATVAPGQAVRFGLPSGGWGLERPDHLLVRSAGHPELVRVPIPWPDH